MWQSANSGGSLSMIVLFYILPFLLAVVLPAWGIPTLIQRILNKKREKLPSLFPFIFSLVVLAFFTNLFWEFALFNKVYYEWDRVFLPYTFFWHESPALDGSSNWIATGWKLWHLHAIWLSLTVLIYLISATLSYWKNRTSPGIKSHRNVLLVSLASLLLITLIIPQFIFKGLGLLWGPTSNLNYQEVSVACTPSKTSTPKIFYTGDQSEWISDLNGNNLRQAFKKHLRLKGTSGSLSPDGSMAAILRGQDLWIYCVNSNGAYKISLPNFQKETGNYEPRSFPSWSPDSKQMVMNNHGDLLLINLAQKKASILKPQVALRDNGIDITSKDRDIMAPPFEFGDAYWSSNGMIYYTAFNGDTVSLRQLDMAMNEDSIVKQVTNPLSVSGDPSGKWLFISETSWATKIDKEHLFSKSYFLNITTGKTIEFDNNNAFHVVWSPSGNYFAQSTGGWMSSPDIKEFPALVSAVGTKQSINVTDLIKKDLIQRNILLSGKAIVVEIRDFIDDSKVLVEVTLPGTGTDIPQQLNGILDTGSGQFIVLQDYPPESFKTHNGGRIEPLQLLK